ACVHGFVSVDVCSVTELTIIVEAPADDDTPSALTLLRRIDGRHRASNQPDAGRADHKQDRQPGWRNTHSQHQVLPDPRRSRVRPPTYSADNRRVKPIRRGTVARALPTRLLDGPIWPCH